MTPLWLLVLVLALAGLALLAYSVRALDAAGAVGSFILGFLVAYLGGLGWLVTMTAFTVLGFAATRMGKRRKEARRVAEARGGERGLSNVLANGAAASLCAVAVLLVGDPLARVAFATAVAAVTADTMASEVGSLSTRARRILPPFDATGAGANGSVSWLGQLAALAGATVIALLAVPLMGLPWTQVWIPALLGFAGCQLDSVLGATLEKDNTRDGILSKGDVNFIASAVPAFMVLLVGVVV